MSIYVMLLNTTRKSLSHGEKKWLIWFSAKKVQLWYIGLKKAMEINGTQLTCTIMEQQQQQQQSTNALLHYMPNHMTMSYKHINKNTFPLFLKSKSLYTHEIPTISEIKLHISCWALYKRELQTSFKFLCIFWLRTDATGFIQQVFKIEW